MNSSSISVEFTVNDLSANYEVIGTSDNYSFQYKIGKGSDLVDSSGESCIKIISLKGNYGEFEVKVFAVSEIGIRSDFIIGSVKVSPPFLDETFKFNNLRFSPLNGGVEETLVVNQSPVDTGGELIVSQQFLGRDVEVLWELTPPIGHPKEGQSVSTDLLSDDMFSGFEVNIKTGGQLIDIGSYSDLNIAIQSLSRQINTSPSNVSGALKEYRQFSIHLDSDVFSGLNLSRDTSLEIVSIDNLGRTATGIISGSNDETKLLNFSQNLNGVDSSFSWSTEDLDYDKVEIDILAVPGHVNLSNSGDLIESKNFIEKINNTARSDVSWVYGFKYQSGDMVLEDDSVYEANSTHSGEYANRPSEGSSLWSNLGSSFDYIYSRENSETDSFSTQQIFSYKYYYTFKFFDDFGPGDLMLLNNGGLVNQNFPQSVLTPLQSNIEIANLRYLERKDDLVFNWDIVDQDKNAVDLIQYRALIKPGSIPSILGLSGSLYDVDSNQILTGITEGFNSQSIKRNENQALESVYNLPSAKIFESFEYTRELNNSIYGTGGFPVSYQVFNYTGIYSSGDYVSDSLGKVYKAVLNTNLEDPQIKPSYDKWSKELNYISGESFIYEGEIYKVTQGFGPKYTDGLFDFSKTYSSGDLVISPIQNYQNFNTSTNYDLNDLVVYDSTLYKSLQYQESGSVSLPGSDQTKWGVTSLFSEVECDIYKAVDSSSGVTPSNRTIQQGGLLVDKWESSTPQTFSGSQSYIQPYNLLVSEWGSGKNFSTGDLVVYSNDIWSGVQNSGPTQDSGFVVPGTDVLFWQNQSAGQDIIFTYNSGDLVNVGTSVYKAESNNPVGAPIPANNLAGEESQSTYEGTEWIPYWQRETQYEDIVFGHIGIPQSGKRNVGIELALVDSRGEIFNLNRLSADNPPPVILRDGFDVDSISEASKVKFNFNYALGFQEKTTKVHLYRSENPVFEIIDESGFAISETGNNSPLVGVTLGASDSTFGQNINQIVDEPPISGINGVEQITGYYYKILPFDDFGSGVVYNATNNAGILERVIVYPKRYNNPNPDSMPGRVLRADPTSAAGAVPGPVVNMSGSTAFENFFLNWQAPNSEYEPGSTNLLKQQQSDIDHYEVWSWSGNALYTGDSQGNSAPLSQENNTGYRRIDGVAYSVSSGGQIPSESFDPALEISGAKNIFDVPANSPSVETVYPGQTNQTESFWIRAVDFAGNKSPFTGAALSAGDDVLGLSLTPGQASATDVTDFEPTLTQTFTNTIALNPNNPFSQNGNWQNHKLFYSGVEYNISLNSTNISDGYIWWQTGNTVYNTGSIHPANVDNNPDFNDGDFIIGRINSLGEVTPAFSVFANALIGTANIADASIVDAQINNLGADKIRAGEIKSADIQISYAGSDAGVIRSVGFTGIDHSDPSKSGFYVSGDGTFAFQGGGSSLSFEDDTLTLRGKLRQTNGFDYDFIDLNVSPNFFSYIEAENYEDGSAGISTFIPDDNSPTSLEIISTFRNSSVTQTGVRFRMDVLSGDNRRSVFDYDEFINNGEYNISGFEYNPNNFIDESSSMPTKIASGSFALGKRLDSTPLVHGFDYIIDEAFPGVGLADSVILYVSGVNSSYEKSITITRINDGKVGESGFAGVTPTYRGLWNNTDVYNFTPSTIDSAGRGDIVSFNQNHPDRTPADSINSNYFIAKQDDFSGQKPIIGGSVNSSYWSEFGTELENVATNILLTNEAYITDKLIIGGDDVSGTIQSNGFTGGLINLNVSPFEIPPTTESYDPAGFLLARTDSGVFFDVGGPVLDSTGEKIRYDSNGDGNEDEDVISYMRFNSSAGKIEIHGASVNNTSREQVSAILDSENQVEGMSGIKDTLATFVGGGYNNNVSSPTQANSFNSLASAIVAGGENSITGRFSFIGAGFSGICNDNFSAIVAGYQNSMPDPTSQNQGANFMGAGQNNTISGGTNQTILGGDNNSIEYTL